MFCTFIFAVLLLKYCFPTGDQLQRYCASYISYSSQASYNCYLLLIGMNEQTRRHTSAMTSPLASIADNTEQNSFYIHKVATQINKLILHASCV